MSGQNTPDHAARAIEQIVASTLSGYRDGASRAAIRSGMGDAAALCDAIAKDIAVEHHAFGGKKTAPRPTKFGQQLAEVAKRCGDAIWKMREKIEISETGERPPRNLNRTTIKLTSI